MCYIVWRDGVELFRSSRFDAAIDFLVNEAQERGTVGLSITAAPQA